MLKILDVALPSLEDVPTRMIADIAALARLDDLALWCVARITISVAQQEKFQSLQTIQQVRPLTVGETAQFEDLLDEIGRCTLLKAEAYRLLHHRGYPVPQP